MWRGLHTWECVCVRVCVHERLALYLCGGRKSLHLRASI